MNLIYNHNQESVEVGDIIELNDMTVKVRYFREPHKPSSSGKISVDVLNVDGENVCREFYVGVLGARWINREDQV